MSVRAPGSRPEPTSPARREELLKAIADEEIDSLALRPNKRIHVVVSGR